MSNSRSYTIGLPVIVTVGEDGSVKLSVDASDLSRSTLSETQDFVEPEYVYTDEQIEADAAAVERAFDLKTMTATVNHQEF